MVTLRSRRQGSRAVAGGRHTGKSMPPETPDLAGLEFCKFMSYGLSWEKLVLPDKFGCTLMDRGLREVKLRVAGGGERGAWDVEVGPDEYGDVYLADGWRDVSVRVRAQTERNSSPPAPAQTGSGSSRGGAGTAEAGIDDPASSQFSVTLRKCHFGKRQQQYLHVPKTFQDAQGYTERTKAVVLQMRGESWTVNLKHWKQGSGTIRTGTAFRYGWHQFLVDNGLVLGDTCFFDAVEEDDEDNVLRVVVRKQDGTIVQ
uniref:Uncharacterized protein n=1 Tax=Avena sativa TaxID=4498 RepID=A0ACD5VXW5_AVESA